MASARYAGLPSWEAIPALITRHARLLLGLVIIITGLAILQIIDVRTGKINLEIDPSVERLLSPDDEAYLFYQEARRIFGSDETILLLLQADDIFTLENMDTISRLTRRLENVDGVVRLASLSNALTIHGSEFGIDRRASWSDMTPGTPEQLQEFRDRILSNPMYAGTLVAEGGNATTILISLADRSGYAFLSRVVRDVRDIIAAEAQDKQTWLTGAPVLNLATTNTLLHDLVRIPAMVALVMAIILVLCFRRLSGVLVPLTSVGISLLWTLAIIVKLGYTLNIVTVLVPTLLLIICLSYSIHVVAEFLELAKPGGNSNRTAADALRSVFLPVVFTGI